MFPYQTDLDFTHNLNVDKQLSLPQKVDLFIATIGYVHGICGGIVINEGFLFICWVAEMLATLAGLTRKEPAHILYVRETRQ